jgi:hypothetical protein
MGIARCHVIRYPTVIPVQRLAIVVPVNRHRQCIADPKRACFPAVYAGEDNSTSGL